MPARAGEAVLQMQVQMQVQMQGMVLSIQRQCSPNPTQHLLEGSPDGILLSPPFERAVKC